MNVRGGIAALLALATLAACGAVPAAASRPPVGARLTDDPAARRALGAAVAGLAAGGYRVTVVNGGGDSAATGAVDPVAGTADLTRHASVEGMVVVEQAIRIRGAAWLRVDFAPINEQLGIPATKWISLVPARATAAAGGPFDLAGADPYDIAGLLAGVTVVGFSAPSRLVGMVDLTRATGVTAPTADELSRADTAAVSTPFTAMLDDRGRLLSLVIDAGRYDRDLTRSVTIVSYGPVPRLGPPPAAEVVPATPLVYQLFAPA